MLSIEDKTRLLGEIKPFYELSATDFALKNPLKFDSETLKFACEQLKGQKVAKEKLPFLFQTEGVIYPADISMQQCTDQTVAKFKSSLFSGQKFVDLTGGFGIDCYFLAKSFEKGIYVERNQDLYEVVSQNYKVLNAENIDIFFGESMDVLEGIQESVDLIYLDPARRDKDQKKVFKIEECEPNLYQILPKLFEKSQQILVKLSPMVDIKHLIESISQIKDIWIISVQNEVKEVLVLIQIPYQFEPKVHAVELPSHQIFSSTVSSVETLMFSEPGNYIYEPFASVMKSGLFANLALQTQTHKLAQNSHLFTSEQLMDFPGRVFELREIIKVDEKTLKNSLGIDKAHLQTRNFPMSTEELRKKLKLKDGGDIYIFATTNQKNKKMLLVCKKIDPKK